MKLLVFTAVLAVAAAAPERGYEELQEYEILKQEFDLRDDQSYDLHFETENGISASESGRPAEGYGDEESYEVSGQFSYTGDDGNVYSVVYVADANGFQPQGDHFPTPVPTEYPTPEADDDEDDDDYTYVPQDEGLGEEEENEKEENEEEENKKEENGEKYEIESVQSFQPRYERVVVGYKPRYQ